MRTTISFSILALTLPACGVPALDALQYDLDAQDTDESTTDADSESSGGPTSTTGTVTTSPPSESESGGSTAGDTDGGTTDADTTTGDLDAPPAIIDAKLDPETIKIAGPIEVTIVADADGVTMSLEDGSVAELTPTEPGVFSGEIFALTGLDNGEHSAVFTPWRGDLEGTDAVVPYMLDLPEAGTEAFWEVDYESGSGLVAALGVLPGGDVVELGTLVGNGTSRCYLRRRDKTGAWNPDHLIDLLPDCKAVDLEVDDFGAIYFLIEGQTNAGAMWWLAKMPAFGAPVKSIGYGAKDEVAHALALSPIEGKLAVCGSAPTVEPGDDSDAMVRVYRPDFSSIVKKFDYKKDVQGHKFDEISRGCDFLSEEKIVVVGDVFGQHHENDPDRSRRFDLTFDVETSAGDLRVAGAGLVTQSVAVDVDVDDVGRAWVVGYICNDVCEPEGQLWMLDGEGDATPPISLGLHSLELLAPASVRWSPAGYAVVASGGLIGSESAFTLRAFKPLKAEPVWTFVREDVGLFHVAHTVAIGPYGEVHAGGFGSNGYPLFAGLSG